MEPVSASSLSISQAEATVAETTWPTPEPLPADPPEPESKELVELREALRKLERPWHVGLRTLLFAVSRAARQVDRRLEF